MNGFLSWIISFFDTFHINNSIYEDENIMHIFIYLTLLKNKDSLPSHWTLGNANSITTSITTVCPLILSLVIRRCQL